MRYLSPTSLCDCPITSLSDKKALTLQRKKWLAELELNTDGFLVIHHQQLSKTDILEYFESLSDETILSYHSIIAQDKTLMTFLEEIALPPASFFGNDLPRDDRDFLEWLSPYFYTAFVAYTTECLRYNEVEELDNLLRNPLLMTDFDRQRAWLQIAQLLESHVSGLEHYLEQSDQTGRLIAVGQIARIIGDLNIQMILLLPEHPFAKIRNRYAVILMQISVNVFNRQQDSRNLAKEWMVNARMIAVSAELTSQISEKIGEMDDLHERKRPSVGAIIFVIMLLFKFLAGANSCHTTPDYKFTPAMTVPYVTGQDSAKKEPLFVPLPGQPADTSFHKIPSYQGDSLYRTRVPNY